MAPAIAADGLSELLDLIAIGSPWFGMPLEDGDTLALTATDSDAVWSVARSGGTVAWSGVPAAAAAVVVSGAAVDLYLLALRRISADDARSHRRPHHRDDRPSALRPPVDRREIEL